MMKRLIKLRVGIAAAYGLVMLPLTGGMVGYLYHVNSKLMIETAAEEMQQVTDQVHRDFAALLDPVRRVVSASSELVRSDTRRITEVHRLGYFQKQLEALPQIFSIYAGFDGTGDFYQIFHIPPSLGALGPWQKDLKEGVQYAVRSIEDYPDGRLDNYIFYGDWGEVRQLEQVPGRYDPRVRPWYQESSECDDLVFSDAYVFSSSQMVGITISKRFGTSSGYLIGVVGADVTLDALSEFLRKTQIGEKGRVFIMDEKGRLIGHPDPKIGLKFVGDTVELLPAADIEDQVTANAVRQWQKTQKTNFEYDVPSVQERFMASFSQMPIGNGHHWTIGVLVDKDELIGPIQKASLQILIVGIVVTLLSILAIAKLSKHLTNPINAIVAKTDRLRTFDLQGDLEITSRIKEVHQLTTAVQTMTRSLRSFSVYVPRELVRAIVSDDGETTLASRRQPMTVMMTDIAGYTKATENKPPEQVVELLNHYFDDMTREIHRNRGIVDKYIGDAIMAIWNAPVSDEQHTQNACRAALACQQACDRMAIEFQAKGEVPYFTRFGLHTGEAVIGNIGSSDRMQYSAIGEMVNMTARLEGLNKVYGTNILISETVASAVGPEFVVRLIDCVIPVGLSKSIKIYELVGERKVLEDNGTLADILVRCEAWETVLQLYFQGQWFQALEYLSAFQEEYPEDELPEVFIKRAMAYQISPPPDDWCGAQSLTEK